MLNPFFLQGSKSEQGLIQDLINEQLKMYGVDVHYLPRTYLTENTVIIEVIDSQFNNAYPIEAYVESYEGYSDNPTILSKFGIQSLNEITLIISRERFKNYIFPLTQTQPNIKLSTRPKEGDLIYFPLGKRLFEIKYVEHEKPFYQLQGLYTYQLRCELFRYEDEVINTGNEEIDTLLSGNDGTSGDGGVGTGGGGGNDPVNIIGNIVNLRMAGIGVTATAITSIVNGGVRFITITNRGGGYISLPTIGFSSAPFGGETAEAIVTETIDAVVCNLNNNPNAESIQNVAVINPGYGYTIAPTVKFIGGGGKNATATATIGDGLVGVVTVTNSGSGYVHPPLITFTGISSVSAAATAVVNSYGEIDYIYLTNAGLGYTEIPTVTIGNPISLNSSGNFEFNEVITGSQSGTTARVKFWDATTRILQVYKLDGEFVPGENIVGSTSNASHYLFSEGTYPARDGYAKNDEIQEESEDIIDFTEINPFGMP